MTEPLWLVYKCVKLLIVMVTVLIKASEGVVTISPSGTARVCNGEQLEVTCAVTEGSLLRWNITLDQVEGDTMTAMNFIRTFSSSGPSSEQTPVNTGSTMITFMRSSTNPLTSILLITKILNGTTVKCIELSTSDSATVVVYPVNLNIQYIQDLVNNNISVFSEQFDESGVTVTLGLEWTPAKSFLISYNISIIPRTTITSNGSAMAQLTILYNTYYNVSISTAAPCGQNSTTYIELNYVLCGNPLAENNDPVIAMGYGGNLALEGSIATLGCPSGLQLIGPEPNITCMGNGDWEPDPRKVKLNCTVIPNCGPPSPPPNGYILPYTSTIEGESVTFACQNASQNPGIQTLSEELHLAICNAHGNWEPEPTEFCSRTCTCARVELESTNDGAVTTAVVSSVTVFILTSIIMLSIGFVCGHCFDKQHACKLTSTRVTHTTARQPIEGQPQDTALYEPVSIDPQQQGLNMTENIAYVIVSTVTQSAHQST